VQVSAVQLVCQTDVSCQAPQIGIDSVGLVSDPPKGRTKNIDLDVDMMAVHLEGNVTLGDEDTPGDESISVDISRLRAKHKLIDQAEHSSYRLVLVEDHTTDVARLEVPILIYVE
jgi:hypothetical protein